MTIPRKYPINPAFAARYAERTGFSLNDPDRRVPIRGHELALQLTSHSPGRQTKADLLLAARDRNADKVRARSLAWLSPLAGLVGWPDRALAHDHHPPLLTMPELPVDPGFFHWIANLFEPLAQVDLSQPVFTLALGGALMMTQMVGIRQRQLILKNMATPDEPPQPDFFPETVAPSTQPKSRFVWESDAATRQGLVRKENQDAVMVIRFTESRVVLIVCDGAGGIEGGREASQSAVEAIGTELRQNWDKTGSLSLEDLEQAIEAARLVAHENQLSGVTTALVVLLQDDELVFATLGDGAVSVVWPDGMIGQVQVPHHTAGQPSNIINAYIGDDCDVSPRVGTLKLEPGVIVMAMTDGASDLFPFEDFALNREKFASLAGLPGHLLQSLEEARDPDTGGYLHSDNLTLAMARLLSGGEDGKNH
ncbi:PP2C family serine/threonine-protein phosphatase [Pseudorhodobacter sp. E13]|uniref:PP2C family protein-serine/threonine phosphatase n=1 Tax=Pseudorhodobacter sp. E13 TaxID=2487931 RepID=UPI001315A418|nr:protein phosphatase 2C domain-containing protein [Pseudorhodobacter sp. E13]